MTCKDGVYMIQVGGNNKAPLPESNCDCGLKAGCVYSGVPQHWTLKSEYFSNTNLQPCFESYYFQFPYAASDVTQYTSTYTDRNGQIQELPYQKVRHFDKVELPIEYQDVGYVWWGQGRFNNSK